MLNDISLNPFWISCGVILFLLAIGQALNGLRNKN
jgi:hypothetical protein